MQNYAGATDLNPDKPFLTPKLRQEIWKKRIEKMVTKTKEIAFSQWAAPILLGLILSYNVYDGQQKDRQLAEYKKESQTQHDLLIELRTIKDIDEKGKAQQKIEDKLDKDQDKWWREKINKDMEIVKLVVQGKYPSRLMKEN